MNERIEISDDAKLLAKGASNFNTGKITGNIKSTSYEVFSLISYRA